MGPCLQFIDLRAKEDTPWPGERAGELCGSTYRVFLPAYDSPWVDDVHPVLCLLARYIPIGDDPSVHQDFIAQCTSILTTHTTRLGSSYLHCVQHISERLIHPEYIPVGPYRARPGLRHMLTIGPGGDRHGDSWIRTCSRRTCEN